MKYSYTQTPNAAFDQWMPELTHSELKILLLILRQTIGWKTKSGKRKTRDRISNSQFHQKANLSYRIIPTAIQSLVDNKLIQVSGFDHHILDSPEKRKGKHHLYYECLLIPTANRSNKECNYQRKAVQKSAYNKRNCTKEKEQNGVRKIGKESDWDRIQFLLKQQNLNT